MMYKSFDSEGIVEFVREHKLYYAFRLYNKKETARFDFEKKRETASLETAKGLLADLFTPESTVALLFYGYDHKMINDFGRWNRDIGKYFRIGSVKRMSKREYYLTGDKIFDKDNNPYFVLGMTRFKNIKIDKYLQDLFNDRCDGFLCFISLKKGVALNFYDARGCDLFVGDDPELLKLIVDVHKDYLLEMGDDSSK